MKRNSIKRRLKEVITRQWRLVFLVLFFVAAIIPLVVYVYYYYQYISNPLSPYREWVWLFSLIIQIILSVAIAILVYALSSQLPQRIYEKAKLKQRGQIHETLINR